MSDDLECKVRAAIEEAVYPLHGHSGGWRISDRVVPVVVRLIEEERDELSERLNREAENHAACDDQTRGIIAGLREHAEKAEAEVARIKALHAPVPWYDECMTGTEFYGPCAKYAKTYGWCLVKPDDHFYVGEDGLPTCTPRRVEDRCAECSDEREEGVRYPCPTIAALDGPTP